MNINTILDEYTPEVLESLSDDELKRLLAPYIPLARQQALPEERARKEGVSVKHIKTMLSMIDPKDLADLDRAHNKQE